MSAGAISAETMTKGQDTGISSLGGLHFTRMALARSPGRQGKHHKKHQIISSVQLSTHYYELERF